MSIFLGGTEIGESDRLALLDELDKETAHAVESLYPHLGEIGAVDCVFNEHSIGWRAAQTAKKILSLGPPTVVFIENVNLTDGKSVKDEIDDSITSTLEARTSTEQGLFGTGNQFYCDQVLKATSRAGSLAFPIDVRKAANSNLEAMVKARIDADFFERTSNGRYIHAYLTGTNPEQIIQEEIEKAKNHSFVLEVREKTSRLQILTVLQGLISRDTERLVTAGFTEEQIPYALEIVGNNRTDGLFNIATVYGSAHRGFFHLMKETLPQARRHVLNLEQINRAGTGNRATYDVMHTIGNREDQSIRETACLAIIEDLLVLPFRHPEIYGALPSSSSSQSKISSLARKLARDTGGAEEALLGFDLNSAIDKMVERGLLFRL